RKRKRPDAIRKKLRKSERLGRCRAFRFSGNKIDARHGGPLAGVTVSARPAQAKTGGRPSQFLTRQMPSRTDATNVTTVSATSAVAQPQDVYAASAAFPVPADPPDRSWPLPFDSP